MYYTAEYTDECKTGINSGTLEFTNKRNELVPTTLPETGGIGERTVEMAGFGLVLMSLAGMALTLTRRKKKAHFGSS